MKPNLHSTNAKYRISISAYTPTRNIFFCVFVFFPSSLAVTAVLNPSSSSIACPGYWEDPVAWKRGRWERLQPTPPVQQRGELVPIMAV